MQAHSHSSSPSGAADAAPRLSIAVAASAFILVLELAGAYVSHSLALLADAVHMATDTGAAVIALVAAVIGKRRRDRKRTFGYGRATVIGALVNAAALVAVTIYLVIEATRRIATQQYVEGLTMFAVAAIALVANGALGWFLSRGNASLNVRAVVVHLMGDALASAAVLVSGAIVMLTGATIADPIATFVVAGLVAWSAYGLLRESLDVLMESAPRAVDTHAMRDCVAGFAGIRDVHDLHVWTVDGSGIAASMHVSVPAAEFRSDSTLVRQLKTMLHERFSVEHATIELECNDCASPACE